MIGANGRNKGSIHSDIWEGSAADLADSGVIAVSLELDGGGTTSSRSF